MPIYEYRCPKCNHKLERLTHAGKPERILCPHCRTEPMKRQMSVFACGQADGTAAKSAGSCPTGTCPFS
ncbi:MAG: zinc ribbon domain-containing protein [Sedimentisphaerales bacterium]|nr:zinc ribbon domain-containing protein [Sedimentisphaerales bacterium]